MLADLLTAIAADGRAVKTVCKSLELRKNESDERQPRWFIEAIASIRQHGTQIDAGAKHALDGLQKDNWKMILKGINHCLDYSDRILTALLDGPPPSPSDIRKFINIKRFEEIAERAFGDGSN